MIFLSWKTARIMRHLYATFSVREVARDQYVHSKYSRELVANPAVDAFKYMYVASFVLFCLLPGQHRKPSTHRHITLQKLTFTPATTTTIPSGPPPLPGSPRDRGRIRPTPATRPPPQPGTRPTPPSSSTSRKIPSKAPVSAV